MVQTLVAFQGVASALPIAKKSFGVPMSRSIFALLVAATCLSACATVRDSNINPFNWFGRDREVQADPRASTNPLIPQDSGGLFRSSNRVEVYAGQPVDAITSVVVERTQGGALVRAQGVSRFINTYDVRLTPVDENGVSENGVLEYRLESIVPERPIPGGSERQRTIIAARALTDNDLSGVRIIRVIGAENARETRRR
jgi:hypothetical protein